MFPRSATSITGNRSTQTIGYPTRDNAGNPMSMTDWTGSWAYGYDANNRLTMATPPLPIPNQPAGGPYGYDWVGNRLNPPTGTNHMVYNAADQLTAWPGMHQYTYFPDGSLQEEKNADGSQVMKSYTYTADGLMASASFDGKTLTNTWDADKNRVSFSADSTNHAFVYDTTAGIPAVVKEDGVYYVREPNGELLARVDGSNTCFYHFDELGSTRLLTDVGGNVTDKYDYDAYGAVIAHEKLAGSIDQPYQYVGQLGYYTCWQEPGLGLMQIGVRMLAPRLGRFTQRDPLASDEVSDTVYANGNPSGFIDPSGKKCHRVDPNHSGNYIGKCFEKLKSCLPCLGKSNVIKRGMNRTKEWYICDPYTDDDGNTYCGVFRKVCRINIYRNKTTTCGTVLHELLHAAWWYTDNNDETKVDSASGLAWSYYCDKNAGCYGGRPTTADRAEISSMLGCSKLP